MPDKSMTIAQLGLAPNTLYGETVIVTGAGGGIGYEAARALLWLGANVVIAEIDQQNGLKAQEALEVEFDKHRALFIRTDVGDQASVQRLYSQSILHFGKSEILLWVAAFIGFLIAGGMLVFRSAWRLPATLTGITAALTLFLAFAQPPLWIDVLGVAAIYVGVVLSFRSRNIMPLSSYSRA